VISAAKPTRFFAACRDFVRHQEKPTTSRHAPVLRTSLVGKNRKSARDKNDPDIRIGSGVDGGVFVRGGRLADRWVLRHHRPSAESSTLNAGNVRTEPSAISCVELPSKQRREGGGSPMVAASKNLLKLARRLAVKDELAAMRLRGQLVSAASHRTLPAAPRPSRLA